MKFLKKSVPLWTLLLTIIVAAGAVSVITFKLYTVSITILPTPISVTTIPLEFTMTAGVPLVEEPILPSSFETSVTTTVELSVTGLEEIEKAYFESLNVALEIVDETLVVVWSGTIDVLAGSVTPDEGYLYPFTLDAGAYGTGGTISGYVLPDFNLTPTLIDFDIELTFTA